MKRAIIDVRAKNGRANRSVNLVKAFKDLKVRIHRSNKDLIRIENFHRFIYKTRYNIYIIDIPLKYSI